jgi:signal transduction histidine kinase
LIYIPRINNFGFGIPFQLNKISKTAGKSVKIITSALLFIIFLTGAENSSAVKFNKDSLLSTSRAEKDPGRRVDVLLLISDHYSSFYPDSALLYANEALSVAKKSHLIGGVVHSYYAFEAIYLSNKNISKAREYLAKGIDFSDKNHYVDGKIEGYMHYSFFHQLLGKNDSMMYYSLGALELSKKSNNLEIQAGVAHDIGNIYSYQGDYDKALYYCRQSLGIWTRIGHKNIAGVLSDIGNIYYNKKDYVYALSFYRSAYENARQNNDALAYGYTLNNIGLVYSALDSFEKAIKYFETAINYYKIDLNKMGIANTEGNLGEVYLKTGRMDLALKHGAISLDLSKELNYKKGILDAYIHLAEVESKQGNFQKAWEYQKAASNYQDTLNNLNLSKKIADYQTRFEIERKDNEFKLLLASQKEQRARQNEINIFSGIILVLLLIIAILAINISMKRKRELNIMSNLNSRITEQKKELEEANEIKTRLFSIVSHDFKSPLASLNLFLTFLESGDFSAEEIKELSRELVIRMNITFSFIDNLLGWAQSQLEGYNPVPVKTNLYDIVESSFDLYRNQALNKKIHFQNEINPADRVVTDDNMLKLVMRNLISNAIKYTGIEGHIIVTSRRQDKEIVISVCDDGIGINEETRKKLFSSQRVNTIGTANEPGTGLGLMLCKDFIEKNGGRIWVESEPGKGSVFSFSVPIA